MAQVTALPVGVTTVTVEFIGTLKSESGGGGTTLNEYTYTVDKNNNGITRQQANTLARILQNAKSIKKTYLRFLDTVVDFANGAFLQGTYTTYGDINGHFVNKAYVNSENRLVIGTVKLSTVTSTFQYSGLISVSLADGSIQTYDNLNVLGFSITYCNDTEIT